jgi:hypothetical protein
VVDLHPTKQLKAEVFIIIKKWDKIPLGGLPVVVAKS